MSECNSGYQQLAYVHFEEKPEAEIGGEIIGAR
jgi:hypothetical protein